MFFLLPLCVIFFGGLAFASLSHPFALNVPAATYAFKGYSRVFGPYIWEIADKVLKFPALPVNIPAFELAFPGITLPLSQELGITSVFILGLLIGVGLEYDLRITAFFRKVEKTLLRRKRKTA
ncbi:hypothetical protein CYMTET_36961 [Cymbomonas tetramitiformis]|uniref:Uncharacterized protein n=1 Tax=Cymbomonas tetramitiformis TaxID=36881 RepID=A0AAE0CG82_9CHLO|nr:hypothetical protein CYMTET_36961 [Cymbomonas tetramitiformis]